MQASHAGEIRVLGPLELVCESGPVVLTALKERQLLAVLVADAGRARSRDFLIDALWGSSPPPSAPQLLHIYVSKLRKCLPKSARIETRGSAYALVVDGEAVDAVRFERLVSEGRDAARSGNAALAASRLRRALALWRGPAYGDVAYEEFAGSEAERLEELRLVAVEERIAAEIELGDHEALVPELLALADTHPLRERLQHLAMLALYRHGRQTEALERYARTRRLLSDELGLEPGAELRELERRILRHDPQLAGRRIGERNAASLPTPPNTLLGRAAELAELRTLLLRDDVRLLTLSGSGGSGKTRLAIEAARESAAEFANGVAFVEVAAVRDPDLLLTAIATALQIDLVGGEPLAVVAAALRARELLLVVDNVEQLRDGTQVFPELLSRAPRVSILATSRVVLHLTGEHVFPVNPLSGDDAVALFVERASDAGVYVDPDTTVTRICDRLDRLPLAIELAAARVRTLTPAELLDRLDRRLPFLTGGPRDLPARQRALRATIEWSVDLLDADERRDLARLSIFAGGCTLQSAEAVCGTTVERLSSLVDQNLVVRTVTAQGSRYSLLETIRELAADLLEPSGDADAVRARHAENALALAQSFGLSVDDLGTGVPQRHDLALLEQDNMRAALDWAEDADPELGLRLALALEQFWVSTNPREGMSRFVTFLARTPDAPLDLRARAIRDLGGSMEVSGDEAGAATHYNESLELFTRLGDERAILRLRHRVLQTLIYAGRYDEARDHARESLELARRGGFGYEESDQLNALSILEYREGNLDAACELARRSLDLGREFGSWPWGETIKLSNLAKFSNALGRSDDAEAYGREGLELSVEIDSRVSMVFCLGALAVAARARTDDERAGKLWGAIEAEEERTLLGRWEARRPDYMAALEPLSAAFESSRSAGRQMALAEAVRYALGPA